MKYPTLLPGLLLNLGALIILPHIALAQPFSGRPSDQHLDPPQYLAPAEDTSQFNLPPLPKKRPTALSGPRFKLNEIRFSGNTVFANSLLQEMTAEFINTNVCMADLEEIRYRVTKLYVDQGYVNSGAVLKPGQKADDGIIIFLIKEGRLGPICLSGNGRLRPSYLQKRLQPDADKPFNINELQERFQLLIQDPLLKKLDGRLKPGLEPGKIILDIDVQRNKPYELSLTLDNERPASLGEEQAIISTSLANLTGFGDKLSGSYELTDGVNEATIAYTLPLNRYNTRLILRYNYSETNIIEEPLDNIDIESESEGFELTLSQPFHHSLQRLFEMGLTFSTRESQTWLLDVPFSFSSGAENGQSQVDVLRFYGSYQDRSAKQALALRATCNLGVDFLGATNHNDNRPDSLFFSWLLQAQYARRLGKDLGQIIIRGDLQIAEDNLLPLEQFAVGGAKTVRGYRENERVGDSGYILSLEWRYPLWHSNFQLAPFLDYGTAWNRGEDDKPNPLFSGGLSFLWDSEKFNAKLTLAHDIEKAVDKNEHSLQDEGVHFSLTWKFF